MTTNVKHMSAKSRAQQQYQGRRGRQYHARVHGRADAVQMIVARERARKLQPQIHADDEVLEFGVGTGLNLRFVACRRRVGYDLSDAGRDVCEAAGIEFYTQPMFQNDEFSVVLCHHTLEHVPDPLAVLEAMQRWLRPGGRLLLYVPFETHRSFRRYRPGDINQHLFSWNPLSLGNLVTLAGYQVLSARISPFGYEQRLAWLSRMHPWLYRCGLKSVRLLRPANEVFLAASRGDEEVT